MKKIITFIVLAGLLIGIACTPKYPDAPQLNIAPNQLALSKVVAIGASYTAGFQSGGLVNDFQKNSYPYLIAKQMGKADLFEMGLLAKPGFGSANLQTGEAFGPMKFEAGAIVSGDPIPGGIDGIKALLLAGGNAELSRPYDNLGIPGADLNDILSTTQYNPATGTGNPFFDLTLRNPTFANTTELEQAIMLQPSLVLMLLPGGNDYLGAALSGTAIVEPNSGFTITSKANHLSRLTEIIDELQSNTRAKIVISNDPYPNALPYVNILDNFVYRDVPIPNVGLKKLPVVFDSNFQPVDFDPDPTNQLYLPLLTQEGIVGGGTSPVKHLLLPFLSQYQSSGLGVPDSASIALTLIGLGFDPATAAALAQQAVQGMIAAGLTPSGDAIPANLTLTEEEETTINDAVDGYNDNILAIAQNKGVAVVDLKTAIEQLIQQPGMNGITDFFVLVDQNTTMWSLDGVHPNNAGQAWIAMEFINKINQVFNLSIPNINPASYTGQYSNSSANRIMPGAIEQAVKLFVRERPRQ